MNISSDQSGRSRAVLIIVLLLVFLLVPVILGVVVSRRDSFRTGSHQATGNTFMSALMAADSQASYQLMTGQLKESVGGQEGWSKAVQGAFEGKEASYEETGVEDVPNPEAAYGKDGNPKRLNYVVRFNDGSSYTMILVVSTEDSELKISEYNSFRR
jgi:hypothetical protein